MLFGKFVFSIKMLTLKSHLGRFFSLNEPIISDQDPTLSVQTLHKRCNDSI